MQPTTQNPAIAQITISGISDFTRLQITNMESGNKLTKKGDRYSASSIRQYTAFLTHLQDFEALHNTKFNLGEINYKFAEAFQIFITNKGLSKNTVGNILSKLKAVLQFSFQEGLSLWNGSGIVCPREITTQTVLSIEEIRKLRRASVTNGERKIVDIFTIQCFTGLRYDTLKKFLENPLAYIEDYEGETYIRITSDKTNRESVISLGDIVKKIITDNGGSFKMPTEESYINRTIKRIGQKAELDNEMVFRRTEGGEMQEKLSPKYKKISSHTARRSMATNLIKSGKTYNDARLILGHSSEAQTKVYARINNIDESKHLFGDSFFSQKID